MNTNPQKSYHRTSLKIMLSLLCVWFLVSFGCGILFRDWLDAHAPPVGNAPFGFWMGTMLPLGTGSLAMTGAAAADNRQRQGRIRSILALLLIAAEVEAPGLIAVVIAAAVETVAAASTFLLVRKIASTPPTAKNVTLATTSCPFGRGC